MVIENFEWILSFLGSILRKYSSKNLSLIRVFNRRGLSQVWSISCKKFWTALYHASGCPKSIWLVPYQNCWVLASPGFFNSKMIYSSVPPKKLNNISYISHVFTKTKQKYFELSWNSAASESYECCLFVHYFFLSNSYKFWIHFHEKLWLILLQCILSIFPASVHQFYANILVFVNINPFLYINNQFALRVLKLF